MRPPEDDVAISGEGNHYNFAENSLLRIRIGFVGCGADDLGPETVTKSRTFIPYVDLHKYP
jgi:hypothetical protein